MLYRDKYYSPSFCGIKILVKVVIHKWMYCIVFLLHSPLKAQVNISSQNKIKTQSFITISYFYLFIITGYHIMKRSFWI